MEQQSPNRAKPERLDLIRGAHITFDRLWKKTKYNQQGFRNTCYHWLAEQLGMPRKQVSMGRLTDSELERVIELTRGVHPSVVKDWDKKRREDIIKRARARDGQSKPRPR